MKSFFVQDYYRTSAGLLMLLPIGVHMRFPVVVIVSLLLSFVENQFQRFFSTIHFCNWRLLNMPFSSGSMVKKKTLFTHCFPHNVFVKLKNGIVKKISSHDPFSHRCILAATRQ
jgi:hypothetical protein